MKPTAARPNRGGPPGKPHREAVAQAGETSDVQRYLRALFARDERGALIEVRYRYRDGMRRAFFDVTDTASAARAIVRLATRTDVYVGVAPRVRRAGGKDAIERVWSLWADLDHPDAGAALDDLPVAPAIQIASGGIGHLHVYWPLATAVSVEVAERGNRRLAAQLHADSGAVTNAATILRPPNSYWHKTAPPKPVVLLRFDEVTTTVQAATAGIAPDPVCAPPLPSAMRIVRRGEDPLRALDPALYVGVLTGQPVGRSRKVRCPLHDDRTPSLHVYEAPEDGWFCFGCRFHGHSVYDLAGAMWNLDTRGSDFVELRSRLYELLLPGQTPPSGRRATSRSRR
ncbi:MAG TPA: CHC2 zinc finger domain-containing protein [Solirubrobacteraceae bacterium]|nr:CHC2 zinc finger domain-containing protein [Solirubrobacteraceae bacterium]